MIEQLLPKCKLAKNIHEHKKWAWKNIRQQCKNNKIKITALAWNDEFELPDGSYSVPDIQDYMNLS